MTPQDCAVSLLLTLLATLDPTGAQVAPQPIQFSYTIFSEQLPDDDRHVAM